MSLVLLHARRARGRRAGVKTGLVGTAGVRVSKRRHARGWPSRVTLVQGDASFKYYCLGRLTPPCTESLLPVLPSASSYSYACVYVPINVLCPCVASPCNVICPSVIRIPLLRSPNTALYCCVCCPPPQVTFIVHGIYVAITHSCVAS